MRPRVQLLILPLAALLAILPMLLRGPSCGHDLQFHLVSWAEAAAQMAHGSYPHWAYTPAYNAGEPRFLFYPPLSWMLGGGLGLVLPWQLVPATFIWVALTVSGFTCFRLLRLYAPANVALVGAVLYLANPYMLFSAYERSAFGELLAAAVLPLLFQAILVARVRVLPVAAAISLLWLSNAPAAVMGCYGLALLTLVRLFTSGTRPLERSFRGLATAGIRSARGQGELARAVPGGTLLGFALAAFYLLPAAYERRWIQSDLALVEGMRISDNTLFHHMPGNTPDTAYHDVVVRSASLVAVILLVGITLALIRTRPRMRGRTPAVRLPAQALDPGLPPLDPRLPLALLAIVIAFLLTPLSEAIWAHVPELRFLQFPWRLMALLTPSLAILTTLALTRSDRLRGTPTMLLSVVLAGLLVTPCWLLFGQRCEAQDTVAARLALFHSSLGIEPTDEYTPATADNDSLHPEDPPFWLIPAAVSASPEPTSQANDTAPDAVINASAPAGVAPGPAPNHLAITVPVPEYLVLNRRLYPAWEVRLNERVVAAANEQREDGLIVLLLPAGTSTVDLALRRTPDETAGLALSGATFGTILLLRFRRRRSGSSR